MNWFIKLFINEAIPALYRHDDSDDSDDVSPSLQSKVGIVPTKKSQQITPDDGYYGLSKVTIAAIPDEYQNYPSAEGEKF